MSWGIKRDKIDAVVSDLVRYRDGWQCLKCRRVYAPFAGLECSHFKSRVHRGTRYDPTNCDTLCAGCHSHFTKNPDEYRAWRIARDGLQRVELLEYKARHPNKMSSVEREWLLFGLRRERDMHIAAYEARYPHQETYVARLARLRSRRTKKPAAPA